MLDWGKTFPGGAKDTVKLLGFSVEYGLERVLAVKAAPVSYTHLDVYKRQLNMA